MEKINFKFKKIRDVKTPTRGTMHSAGLDFFIPNDYDKTQLRISPHSDIIIHSGICVDMMSQPLAFIVKNKSGVVTSRKAKSKAHVPLRPTDHVGSIIVGADVVDSDYQGEIMIHLINLSDYEVVLHRNDKIVQLVAVPIYYPELIETDMVFETATERGTGAMGSTNEK